jgi:hypothetical protein
VGKFIHITTGGVQLAEHYAGIFRKKLGKIKGWNSDTFFSRYGKHLVGVDRHQAAVSQVDPFAEIPLQFGRQEAAGPESEFTGVDFEQKAAASTGFPLSVLASLNDPLLGQYQIEVKGDPLFGQIVAHTSPITGQGRPFQKITGVVGVCGKGRLCEAEQTKQKENELHKIFNQSYMLICVHSYLPERILSHYLCDGGV